jgi:hypothetical protein
MRTLLLGLAILMASVVAAAAITKLDRKCYREFRKIGFTHADSIGICTGKMVACEIADPKIHTAEQIKNCFRE